MSRRDNRKCVVPAGRYGSWYAASFYRASVPGGTWEWTMYDVRFATYEVQGDIHHGRGPAVDARGSAAYCVRSGMAGAAGGNRGRWAARGKAPATARPSPPPISLSSPRLRRTIPRNAVALSGISRFAICEVRCMIRGAFTASERRYARSAINTIRSVVMGMPAPAIGISERCYRLHPLTSVSHQG